MAEKNTSKCFSTNMNEQYRATITLINSNLKVRITNIKTSQEWEIFTDKIYSIDKKSHIEAEDAYDIIAKWKYEKHNSINNGRVVLLPETYIDNTLYLSIICFQSTMSLPEDIYRIKFNEVYKSDNEDLKTKIQKLEEEIADLKKYNLNFKSILRGLSHYLLGEIAE